MKAYLIDRLQFLAVGVLAVLIGMVVAVTSFAWFPSQAPKKVFTKRELKLPEIVQVIEIERKNQKVAFGAGIDADDDWLNGTTFKIKNYSGREIVHLELHLNFPETKALGNEMSFPIYLGRRPGVEDQRADPVAIAPDEEVSITLDENTYAQLKRFLEYRQPISKINQVTVLPYLVVFADGIAWGQGEYYRSDPDSPKRFIPIGNKPPQNNQ